MTNQITGTSSTTTTAPVSGFDVILNALHKRDDQAGAVCRTIGALDFDVERLDSYTPATLRNIIKRVHRELREAYNLT